MFQIGVLPFVDAFRLLGFIDMDCLAAVWVCIRMERIRFFGYTVLSGISSKVICVHAFSHRAAFPKLC